MGRSRAGGRECLLFALLTNGKDVKPTSPAGLGADGMARWMVAASAFKQWWSTVPPATDDCPRSRRPRRRGRNGIGGHGHGYLFIW